MSRTINDLVALQNVPLSVKIVLTKDRIRQWYNEFGGDVYVSFSGGKDSTVLLHLVRKLYPDVEAVFIDTGLEYPEIRDFVRTFDNVTCLKPKKSFKQVVTEYGYPFISKEVSMVVKDAKQAKKNGKEDTSYAVKQLNGEYINENTGKISSYNKEKWKPLLDAPFNVSHYCCNVMKKAPLHEFGIKQGKKPFTAQMADESRQRRSQWIKNGCNGFQMKSPISNPMSFWTEQDVLHYILQNNIEICSVYGDIIPIYKSNQMCLTEDMQCIDSFITEDTKLKTTGCNRTGCMFCGYGAHCKGDTRFLDMKSTHPDQYNYIFKPENQGGLGYKEKIGWINENCGTEIKY